MENDIDTLTPAEDKVRAAYLFAPLLYCKACGGFGFWLSHGKVVPCIEAKERGHGRPPPRNMQKMLSLLESDSPPTVPFTAQQGEN